MTGGGSSPAGGGPAADGRSPAGRSPAGDRSPADGGSATIARPGWSTGVGDPTSRPDTPRQRLLQAAREVVASDGLEGLTLRAIARRAGVSHGAPLRHFPSLAALLAALAAEGFAGLIAAVDAAVAATDAEAAEAGTTPSPRRRLARAGEAYVGHARSNPGVFTVMFRQERVDVTDSDYQAQGFAAFRQLVELVAAAQAEGWRADDDTTELAAVLWANVHGLAELAIHGALAGVVGAEAADRLPLLSTTLALGLDPDTRPDIHPTPDPISTRPQGGPT